MIIQLKGADASAENLGKVNIPEQFDVDTMMLLSNMTKYSLYSNEALCVNQLIVDLKENNLWDKVELFYTPWMAASVDELEYNLQGVAMSVDKNNLYFQDGDLYAYTINADMSNIDCGIPDVDIKNKFIVFASPTSVNDANRRSMAYIKNINGNLCAISVPQFAACGLGTEFNFNNVLSPFNMYKGGVINISSSFDGVNPSDLTTFTVNGLTPNVFGSLGRKTETKVNRINLSRHFGQTTNPTKLWVDYYKVAYIIGNAALSSSEVTTMVSIITKYSNNI